MDLADVLRRRKMVRNYTDEPVPRGIVERIVARGRKVPSGGFSQGLRLVVVTEPETRHGSRQRGLKPLEEVIRWERW